ncbi:MAG: hypothetical protein PHG60_02670 [Candidatus Dojkabacteria bacterium]|jgi:hypothetical protein|nr:hypothetical protein [Candidatus Dojkabacteria bacterium]
MSEKIHRKKIIVMFTALSLFAYLSAKKLGGISVENKETVSNQYSIEQKAVSPANERELVQDVFYEVDANLDPVKQIFPGTVLAASEGSGECRTTDDLVYSSKKICSIPITLTEDFGRRSVQPSEGELISRDASIRLVSVVVPPLLSGSPTMDSSVKQIYKDEENDKYHWTLKPAGEMVSENVVAGTVSYPGDTKTKEILDKANENKTQPFALTYGVQAGENASGGGKTDFTVSEYHTNDCIEDCDNSPNPTPEKYLKTSTILAQSKNYPTYYEKQVSEETDDSIGDCEESDSQFLTMDLKGEASRGCTPSFKQVVLSFFKKIKNLFDAQSCTVGSEVDEGCVSVSSIVIIMESPWGTKVDCRDNGQCTNEFNELRDGDFRYPGEGKNGNVYVVTDCDAYIEGSGTRTLKCAWDIDYIAKEVEFQASDNVPGEEYPDTMDYVGFHVKESGTRTDKPIAM